jgi:opacity protein-like surface antigen
MRRFDLVLLNFAALSSTPLLAQETSPATVQSELHKLEAEVAELKAQDQARAARESDMQARYQSLLEELDSGRRPLAADDRDAWYRRFTFGGYGETHFTSLEHSSETIDIARFVAYVGYRFNDWIQLHSEVEIEGGLVAPDAEGELSIEQLHMDFLFDRHANVRVGRFLTPLGIINQHHEPPSFNGVLRPDFDTFIIPTTWVMDGAGLFGEITDDWKYELYVGSSLDGAGFDPVAGIREGRQEGVPSLSQPALTGRLDYFALRGGAQSLRLGLSFFGGGLNNGPGGVNPGIDARIQVYSADFQYSVSDFDFLGEFAFENIDGAASIGNDVASEISGYYVEGAYHFWPERWKSGRLEKSDAIAFVRYDDLDTQRAVPSGVTPDPLGDRNVVTVGLSFFPTTNVVIKTDYQFYDDATDDDTGNRFNVGLGFSF